MFVQLQLRPCEQNAFLEMFVSITKASFPEKRTPRTYQTPLPPNNSRYKYRRREPLQHSVCCPLNRTIIMNTVVLAVLMLLAVTCVVSGAPAESGKSRYGDEICLVVILQTIKC